MILALYLRLSKEDKNVVDESNSITNQRHVLHKYVEDRPEFGGYELREYVDDGYSGKNFDRPGVKRLLQEVKEGKNLWNNRKGLFALWQKLYGSWGVYRKNISAFSNPIYFCE